MQRGSTWWTITGLPQAVQENWPFARVPAGQNSTYSSWSAIADETLNCDSSTSSPFPSGPWISEPQQSSFRSTSKTCQRGARGKTATSPPRRAPATVRESHHRFEAAGDYEARPDACGARLATFRKRAGTALVCASAPVAQWIEQRFPKPRALVRFRPGASARVPVLVARQRAKRLRSKQSEALSRRDRFEPSVHVQL